MGLGIAIAAVLAIFFLIQKGAAQTDAWQCRTANSSTTCSVSGQLQFPFAQNFTISSTFIAIGNSSDAAVLLSPASIAAGKFIWAKPQF
jgi:hypothetical protein